jgi:hypothetical protein
VFYRTVGEQHRTSLNHRLPTPGLSALSRGFYRALGVSWLYRRLPVEDDRRDHPFLVRLVFELIGLPHRVIDEIEKLLHEV